MIRSKSPLWSITLTSSSANLPISVSKNRTFQPLKPIWRIISRNCSKFTFKTISRTCATSQPNSLVTSSKPTSPQKKSKGFRSQNLKKCVRSSLKITSLKRKQSSRKSATTWPSPSKIPGKS